ncbi:hypothetical protein HK096_008820 [Nowakowskiella sp. JEL0078]|nr:hypothetical protein HK096_008820 [Nowakowskiella sp. JEL0078]
MTISTTVQTCSLGILLGLLSVFATYDSPWWSYLLEEPALLKSKITSQIRADSLSFYKRHERALVPLWISYIPLIVLGFLFTSTVAGLLVDKGVRRLHAIVLLLSGIAVSSHLVLTVPNYAKLTALKSKLSSLSETVALRDIALGHAVSAIAIIITLFLLLVASIDTSGQITSADAAEKNFESENVQDTSKTQRKDKKNS